MGGRLLFGRLRAAKLHCGEGIDGIFNAEERS